jgi:aminopeptidase N
MAYFALRFAVCASAAFAAVSAAASASVAIDSVPGALPKTIAPVLYDIDIVPDLKTMKIHGRETVTINVLKPTATVVVNALQTTVSLATVDGIPASSVRTGDQTLTMAFPHVFKTGMHRLAIAYTATVQTSAQGLFVQKYTDQTTGKPAELMGTQFESTDARRMFPGWDEPVFRAKYHLTATLPSAWTAVSNMPIETSVAAGGDRKRVSFATSPSMPSYLLVFCAGDFDMLTGSAGATKIDVYGTRGTGPELTYARDSLERLVPYFETYYGEKFPLPKIDLIAIPQFFGGAMENWGGMTFTESTVVFDPKLQAPRAQREIFDIIAHETSHQWNGDLVTMAWWDSLWLNEGFATWMESKSTAELNPTWNWWLGFDNATNGSLIADARLNTTKVGVPVHNETEANTVFDPEIAYQKAGAFLRMMEAYLGPDTFRVGLHSYFSANAFASTVPNDLWKALSASSHRDVATIAHSWIDEPGFPIVNVAATCAAGVRTLELSQHRYATFDDRGTTLWAIPLEIETGDGKTTPYLFDAATATVPGGGCDTPLDVNGDDLGYYRVSYDAAQQALQQQHFVAMSPADRIALLDDAWTFAIDGKSQLSDYLAYLKAETGDADVHVAGAILRNFATMSEFEFGQPGEPAFKAVAISYLSPLLATLGGWDGPTSDVDVTGLRLQVIRALASADDPATIAEARKRYAAGVVDPTALRPPLKDVVLAIVGRNADAQTYGALAQAGIASRNPIEAQTYFQSAFAAKDEMLAQKSLDASLGLPPQYSSFAPVIVAIVGQDHPALAWDFMKKNDAKLYAGLSEFDRIPYITGVSESFWRGVPIDDITAYLKAKVPAAASHQVDQTIEDITRLRDQRTRLLPQIDAYVAAAGAAPATIASPLPPAPAATGVK